MCDKNINELLNIDFSVDNDQFNWLSNTNTNIDVVDGKLKLIGESATSSFTRSLGMVDPANNRIQLKVKLNIYRPQASTQSTFCSKFEVFNGSQLIDVYTIYLDDIESGESVQYLFDRVYKYEGLSGNISLKITTVEGWDNNMLLEYLYCDDYNYCDDDVRNYFLLDTFFLDSLGSVSSAFQLLEYKIDGVETLTPAFFSENSSPGGNPLNDWYFAKADLDGSNRVSETTDPNTFNPLVSELGLDYDIAEYYGGKPIGTITGSDYGSGVLNIGFEKPSILNGVLQVFDGAFFVDIDFTKNLKIVFNVVVNNSNANVFNSPNIYREYTISWNASTCTSSFYYIDILDVNAVVDQNNNGFLSGITGTESTIQTIGCDENFSFTGESGTFEVQINFGTLTGNTGIQYNAFGVPDKFEIEWNGQVFSSGYVGLNTRDQDLLNLGIPQSQINTGNPSTGIGNLIFNKDSAEPQLATIRVTAPFPGTAWNLIGVCPDGGAVNQPPTVEISSSSLTVQQGVPNVFDIISSDPDGTIVSYNIIFGNEGSQNGNVPPPSTINKTFNTLGTKTIQITVTDNDGLTATDSIQINVVGSNNYQTSGSFISECLGGTNFRSINGTLTVTSGSVTVLNGYDPQVGGYLGCDVTINGVVLNNNEQTILGVGVYPFTSTVPDCSLGSGINELIIITP